MTEPKPSQASISEPAQGEPAESKDAPGAHARPFKRMLGVDRLQLGVLLICSVILLAIWLHYVPS